VGIDSETVDAEDESISLDEKGDPMQLSARNQLKGTVKQVIRGAIMGEVVVDIGGQEVVSSITLSSIERLSLKVGDPVFVIIKATDAMIGK
jgi:molybdopterin-binding protein